MFRIIRAGFNHYKDYPFKVLAVVVLSVLAGLFTSMYSVDLKDHYALLVSAVSIFAGVIMALVILIAGRGSSAKNALREIKLESDQASLKRFINFSRQLIAQGSFAVLLCIIICILILMASIKKGDLKIESEVLIQILSRGLSGVKFLVSFCSVSLLFCISDILKETFEFFNIDLDFDLDVKG